MKGFKLLVTWHDPCHIAVYISNSYIWLNLDERAQIDSKFLCCWWQKRYIFNIVDWMKPVCEAVVFQINNTVTSLFKLDIRVKIGSKFLQLTPTMCTCV